MPLPSDSEAGYTVTVPATTEYFISTETTNNYLPVMSSVTYTLSNLMAGHWESDNLGILRWVMDPKPEPTENEFGEIHP